MASTDLWGQMLYGKRAHVDEAFSLPLAWSLICFLACSMCAIAIPTFFRIGFVGSILASDVTSATRSKRRRVCSSNSSVCSCFSFMISKPYRDNQAAVLTVGVSNKAACDLQHLAADCLLLARYYPFTKGRFHSEDRLPRGRKQTLGCVV